MLLLFFAALLIAVAFGLNSSADFVGQWYVLLAVRFVMLHSVSDTDSVSDILTYFICTNKFVFINWYKKTKGYNKMHRITLILFELGRSILRHFCIIVLCTCLSPMTVSMSLLNILNKSDVCSCCTVVCLLECDLRSVWCFVFT